MKDNPRLGRTYLGRKASCPTIIIKLAQQAVESLYSFGIAVSVDIGGYLVYAYLYT